MGRFIMLNENNVVASIRYGNSAVAGEIESDTGELGQIMQADGTFITTEPVPSEPVETIEDKLDWLILNAKGLI